MGREKGRERDGKEAGRREGSHRAGASRMVSVVGRADLSGGKV